MAGHLCVLGIALLFAVILRETPEDIDQKNACRYSSHTVVFNTTNSYDSPECHEYRADAKSAREMQAVVYYSFRDSEW